MSKRILNKIEREASKLTINLEGTDCTLEELEALSRTAFNSNLSSLVEPISEILNDKNINEPQLNEIKNYIKKQGANKWKAKIRKDYRDGKLEQYQIDKLNKLGMIWYPKGGGGSFDDWENNYLIFKNFGFCIEVREWVNNQRDLFRTNKIPKENLFRLEIINFPFESNENEEYKLTSKHLWGLRQQLEKKMEDYINVEKEKLGISAHYDKLKAEEQIEKEFYINANKSFDFMSKLSNLSINESFDCLDEIIRGNSIYEKVINVFHKEALENELKIHKELNKKIPKYIINYYQPIKKDKLTDLEIYNELGFFNSSKIVPKVRKKACEYMLKLTSKINMRSTKFSEVNYLISEFKKEKNLTELIELSLFIREYPILKELYLEKLENTILKLSSKKQKS